MSKTKRKSPRKEKAAKSKDYVDRNLAAINPISEQFEPTESSPVRQRARMAGQP